MNAAPTVREVKDAIAGVDTLAFAKISFEVNALSTLMEQHGIEQHEQGKILLRIQREMDGLVRTLTALNETLTNQINTLAAHETRIEALETHVEKDRLRLEFKKEQDAEGLRVYQTKMKWLVVICALFPAGALINVLGKFLPAILKSLFGG